MRRSRRINEEERKQQDIPNGSDVSLIFFGEWWWTTEIDLIKRDGGKGSKLSKLDSKWICHFFFVLFLGITEKQNNGGPSWFNPVKKITQTTNLDDQGRFYDLIFGFGFPLWFLFLRWMDIIINNHSSFLICLTVILTVCG